MTDFNNTIPAQEKSSFIGMDVGGSNIFSVLFDSDYKPIMQDKIDTDAREGYSDVMKRMRERLDILEQESNRLGYELLGIGIGVPGVVSGDATCVRTAPNLGWNEVYPLKDLGLDDRAGLNSLLVNDVNAGHMGELTLRESSNGIVVSFFCGTGVGGALSIDGNLVTGFDGGAGEVGHMIVSQDGRKCGCGRYGCLEAYIGKWALNDLIQKAIDKKKTVLRELIPYDLSKKPIKSSSLKKAYEKNDPYVRDLMENYYSRHLAVGISQVVNFINPQLVILGGGMMESLGKYLLSHIYHYMDELCINTPPQLQLAELGDFAGPTGAAYLSRSKCF